MLIAAMTSASNLGTDWPGGKAEKLTYEIKVTQPMPMTNTLVIEISKSSGPRAVFSINQTLQIPSQNVTVKAFEKYNAADLRLISCENYFKLPAQAAEQLGTDSISIHAVPRGDSLEIISNVSIIPSQTVAVPRDIVTSVGASLFMRGIDFKIGNSVKFNEIDLISLMSQNFTPAIQEDSVIGEIAVTVPAGTFDCFKTKNVLGAMFGYGYYTKDKNHIPIMLEIIDTASNKQMAVISLLKVE
jgi:hypothetical protein